MVKTIVRKDYAKIIKNLTFARESQGIRQHALAKELGKTQSFVSKYERRERRLDVMEFLDVSRALGVDPSEMTKNLPKP
ncbi:MAG: transcriptional regulator [Alphaproteobacteria bacterium]|nr:MAG: transcriptional regulator [Alphaproteobacteria bacterium]